MTDQKIIELYFARSEDAIAQTQAKYNDYCFTVANNILCNRQDAEECVNDTYLAAWNHIPPERPNNLAAYLARITRNFALKRCRAANTEKRSVTLVQLGDELLSLIPDGCDLTRELDSATIAAALSKFLRGLSARDRKMFVMRYFYGEDVRRIARTVGIPESTAQGALAAARAKLAKKLTQEGIIL